MGRSARSLLPLGLLSILLGGVVVLGVRALAGWTGPALPIGAAVVAAYTLWCLSEGVISVRDASAAIRGESWSTEVYAIAQGATALAALGFAPRAAPGTGWVVGGAIAFAAGLGVRVASVRALGRSYSHRVRVAEDHALVTHGPYTVLRHPAYAGLLLAHAGLVACFPNVPAACALILLGGAVIARIRAEERVLRAEIPGYEAFCRTRRRLLPFVW